MKPVPTRRRLTIIGTAAILALGGSGAALAASGAPAKQAPAAQAFQSASTIQTTFTNYAGQQNFGSVACPANTRVSGGGVYGAGGTSQSINSSYPTGGGTGWGAFMNNTSTTNSSFTVYAICSLAA